MRIDVQKITPCLCFDDQAEAAVRFYVTTFKDAELLNITRCGADEPGGPEGSVRTVAFRLFGQNFLAVNGGPHFEFNDGISLVVNCDTQEEVDDLWSKLSAGGETIQCGWLKDRFGVFWQIVPAIVSVMMTDPDPLRSQRVMRAILKMVKLDITTLQQAYAGTEA